MLVLPFVPVTPIMVILSAGCDEPVCAQPRQRPAAGHNLHILRLLLGLALADDNSRAALQRLGDKPVAV